MLINYKTTLAGIIAGAMLLACGVKAQTTVLTDSSGQTYPYAVVVTYQGLPSEALAIGFTTQAQAETFAAEQAKDPKKTVRIIAPNEAAK